MSSKPARRPGETAFAVLCVVFGLVAFWHAYGISGFTGLSTPGVFPMLATGAMVVSGLFILAGTLRRPAEPGDGNAAGRFVRAFLPLRHCVLLVLMLAYLAALPLLGFVVASALFLFAAFQYLWRRNVLVTLVLSAVALAAIYVVFRIVFQVVLPQGSLVGRLF
ncbi:tripartite tricarboxylate transporter TctB family protein [Aquibium carbonis]|uniref:Tripartite tricarboxylate transporter TctB family protein n=1 Tax=Aquibium carbonis TaxID=2495581 RepID=A0A429Z1C7_9HYPH|nr:tripartite tricarboxylate transporter TctB family protein [Aquibium carbonis]RST87542.1 tripartite tricarboxylate transporter TctB family protein [Aquibium carbonis]